MAETNPSASETAAEPVQTVPETGKAPEQPRPKKKFPLKKLVITALLAALIFVLQAYCVIPIPGTTFQITFTLIPIVVGAVLLGWQYGLSLGLIFGVVASVLSLIGRDAGGFLVFQADPALAWAVCLAKGAAAGVVPALIYRAFNRFKYAPHFFIALSGVFLALGGYVLEKVLRPEELWQSLLLILGLCVIAAGYMLLAYRALKSENTAVYLASMSAPVANTGVFILGMVLFFRPLLLNWASVAGYDKALAYILFGLAGVNFTLEFTLSVILSPAVATVVKAVRKEKE